MTKNRIATAIALFLMLTLTLTVSVFPIAKAHTPPRTLPTYSYVSASPNPIGVGQQAVIVFWLDKVPPTATGAFGDRWDGWTEKWRL